MRSPPYPMSIQVKLVRAACAIHDYIREEEPIVGFSRHTIGKLTNFLQRLNLHWFPKLSIWTLRQEVGQGVVDYEIQLQQKCGMTIFMTSLHCN